MAESLFGFSQRVRTADPLVSQNLRKYVDKKTLAKFTSESRHQISVFEEELFQLHCQRQTILRKESELIYMLHDLILQEKYLQLNAEKREYLLIPDAIKSEEQRTREKSIVEGMELIVQRRDEMLNDLDVERLRELEEDEEREEKYQQMKEEWKEMKMSNFDYSKGWRPPSKSPNSNIFQRPCCTKRQNTCSVL